MGRIALPIAIILNLMLPCISEAQVFPVRNVAELRSALANSQDVTGDDMIDIAPGVYSVTTPIDFTATSNYALIINGAGADSTSLNGGSVSRILRIDTTALPDDSGAHMIISGITFTGGNAIAGGGLFIQTNNANITVEKSVFSNNAVSSDGGGINARTVDGTVLLRNNIFTGNTAGGNGGGVNIVIAGTSGIVNFTSSTVSGTNSAGSGGGLYVVLMENTAAANIYNNIIWGNVAASGGDLFVDDNGNGDNAGSTIDLVRNDFQGFSIGCASPCVPSLTDIGNLNEDPLLTTDFHILANSPAIDTGNNFVPGGLTLTDMDGDPRGLDGDGDSIVVADMGADEFDPLNPPEQGNGSVPPKGGGAACFIATAAFGSSMAGEVEVLRAFRDRYLLTNEAGRAFVRLYYRYSPPLAAYIAEHESVRTAARLLLTPLVFAARYTFVAVILLGMLTGIAVRKKKARQHKAGRCRDQSSCL